MDSPQTRLPRAAGYAALALVMLPAAYAAEPDGPVGAAVCAQCHRAIAAGQMKSNMARTWQGVNTAILPAHYQEGRTEGQVAYRAARNPKTGLEFEVTLPGREPVKAPVEDIVGAERHGISFLVRLRSIEGIPLERAPLVETRYLHSTHENALVLSPGFPEQQPSSYETALGRALSPSFEKKCLECHGQQAGVRCESCHGGGRAHLEAVAAGKPHEGIVNPGKVTGEQSMEACARCHSGFAPLSDPIPDDLLISNQVNALKNSECYVESEGGLRCTTCHDPHQDSPQVAARSVQACLGCHSARVERHAGLCPVNREGACLGCHMPEVKKGSFHMVDHWIGVHPEQHTKVPATRDAAWTTQVRPRRAYLRIIVTDDAAKAQQAHARLEKGESFFDVAREVSVDPSATGGGFLGEMALDRLDPALADAAASLAPGGFSRVIGQGGKHIILERLPRDFRSQADRLQQEATALRMKGSLAEAADKYQEALRVYPRFLRALVFLGATFGQQANPERAVGVLEYAARLYPKDPAAQYNLGIAYGTLGRGADEISAYRRALELEPDLIPAYQNLGASLYAAGQADNAIEVYKQGLKVDPLSAVLYYNVGVIERDRGRIEAANAAIGIARKIDPQFVKQQEGVQ